jgi:small-conductance mechanosensitive channel
MAKVPMIDLLLENESAAGRLVTTLVIVAIAVVVALLGGRLIGRAWRDSYTRYYSRKVVRYVTAVVTLVALAVVWRPFAGQIGVVLGLIAAGVAFAMQELIGAFAGWLNVLFGRIYRVGDRVQVGGVRGDVIDITPLRTKILEMGSPPDTAGESESWVAGRQYTGRIVTVSNKKTFTDPVFNYSAAFDYIWEELTIPVPYESDWRRAEAIILEEVQRTTRSEEAQKAMAHMARHYPVPRTELEPRVFARATSNWVSLAARFVVPVRTARTAKDEVTRRILDRLKAAGIEVASETAVVTVKQAEAQQREAS